MLDDITQLTLEELDKPTLWDLTKIINEHYFFLLTLLFGSLLCLALILKTIKNLEKARDSEARYMSRSVLLKESQNPVLLRAAILFSGGAIISFFIWAASMDIDEIAVANGVILQATKVQQIQHPNGGVITEILVEDGAEVSKGQALLKLDPLVSRSQLEQTVKQLELMHLARERLNTFIKYVKLKSNGRSPNGIAPDFRNIKVSNDVYRQKQTGIYLQQVASYNSGRSILEHRASQFREEHKELVQKEKVLEQQKEFLKTEEEMKRELVEEGVYSKLEFLNIQQRLSNVEGELAQIEPKKNKVIQQTSGANNRLEEYDSEVVRTNLVELVDVNNKLAQLTEVAKRNTQVFEQLVIKAPVDGRIHGLTKNTIGGVVNPGEIILKIVPKDKIMIAEVKISSRDIGHVQLGQRSMMKFTTYIYGRYGGIVGKVKSISASTFADKTGEPYYKGTVILAKDFVGVNPKSNKILPGMTVQAEIKTGSKTVLQYLFKPVFTTARQALRER